DFMRIPSLCLLIIASCRAEEFNSEEGGGSIYDDEPTSLEVISVKNDKASVAWKLPDQIGKQTTKQRLMITIRPGQTSAGA
ncbi:hypothetical protein PENTCL1PPCAC_3698, partial [Pristionchus entomophagus]